MRNITAALDTAEIVEENGEIVVVPTKQHPRHGNLKRRRGIPRRIRYTDLKPPIKGTTVSRPLPWTLAATSPLPTSPLM
jgi:hypothetical protein